jgi:hypothetical protein
MKTVRAVIMYVLALTSISAGCSSPTAPTNPLTAELGVGESMTYGPLNVTFVEVSLDNRCPLNALGIQQGDATFVVTARVRGNASRYDLQINDPVRRSVIHAGYVITATELGPYPYTINPTDPASYRLTLTVEKD